ncbi:MAG: 30S ribosomal protein S8 [Patescibacteria group bacterium]
MVTDPVSDLLIRIKNAQAVSRGQVLIPFSKMKLAMANVLKDAGYLAEVERKKKFAPSGKKTEHEYLLLTLKYLDGEKAIQDMKIISKPSRRIYIKAEEIRPVHSGYGLAVISTSQGVMNSKDAKKRKLGGELICEIW